MKMFVQPHKVLLYRHPVDFRKSINGLVMIVEQQLTLSPFDGTLFMFCIKNRDKLKLIYWDNTGFALWYKRLEKDKFKWPQPDSTSSMHLSEACFNRLLKGFDIQGHSAVQFESVGL